MSNRHPPRLDGIMSMHPVTPRDLRALDLNIFLRDKRWVVVRLSRQDARRLAYDLLHQAEDLLDAE